MGQIDALRLSIVLINKEGAQIEHLGRVKQ